MLFDGNVKIAERYFPQDRDYHQDITFYPDGQVDGQDSRPEKYQQQPYRHQKGMQQV